MAIELILQHIIDQANAEKERIINEARLKAKEMESKARLDAEYFYKESMKKEAAFLENTRQKLVINARLGHKKEILRAKQEVIDEVFLRLKSRIQKDKLKKELVFADRTERVEEDADFYIKSIRPDLENEVAKILFE